MYSGDLDYYRYSYCGALILIGFVVNLVVIGRCLYDRRKGFDRRRSANKSIGEKLNEFYLPFTILTCFVASSNLLLLITRDLGHLLETATGNDWRSTNFVCKLYKFTSFLAYHACSYGVLTMVACTCWYVCRGWKSVPKQNRIGMLVAVAWALAVAFCAPLYHVAGLADVDENYFAKSADRLAHGRRRICYTIRPHDPSNTDVVFSYYPYFLIATILVIPAAAIAICYLLSGRRILAQRRQPPPAEISPVLLVQIYEGESEGRDEVDPKEEKLQSSDEKAPLPTKRPPKPERRSKSGGGRVKNEKMPLTNDDQQRGNEISETEDLQRNSTRGRQINSTWKICRIAAIVALTYAVCWVPYAVVFLLVSKGDVDPDTLGITIPTYMLFLLYPIVSGVCLIV